MSVVSTPLRIAIAGATGAPGTAITRALLQHGSSKARVALLLRPLPKDAPAAKHAARADFASKGAHIIDVDVETASVGELATALAHTDVLLSIVGVGLLKEGQLKLLAAAQQAGVRRFLPSEFGFDMGQIGRGSTVPPWDHKLDVQAAVQQSGLEYTFVETGLFGEYMVPFAGIDVATHTITAPGSFATQVSISPLGDVGAQVADLLLSGRGRNETVFLATVTTSWAELHAALERVSGHAWSKVVKSAAEYQSDVAANEHDWVARVALLLIKGSGTHFPQQHTYARNNNIALASFDDFLRTIVAPK